MCSKDSGLAQELQLTEEHQLLELELGPGVGLMDVGAPPTLLCYCLVCQRELTSHTIEQRERHLNSCLNSLESQVSGRGPSRAGAVTCGQLALTPSPPAGALPNAE
jgi:hypothetical protein